MTILFGHNFKTNKHKATNQNRYDSWIHGNLVGGNSDCFHFKTCLCKQFSGDTYFRPRNTLLHVLSILRLSTVLLWGKSSHKALVWTKWDPPFCRSKNILIAISNNLKYERSCQRLWKSRDPYSSFLWLSRVVLTQLLQQDTYWTCKRESVWTSSILTICIDIQFIWSVD